MTGEEDRRRGLPSVESVVSEAERILGGRLGDGLGPSRPALTELARLRLGGLRQNSGRASAGAAPDVMGLARELAAEAGALLEGTIQPVINATGVVLQTNLGRSPLSVSAIDRLAAVAKGYVNLEYDLKRGGRGERAGSLAAAFRALLGQPGLVVNNNAASLLLLLHGLARGREVIVSRGELIEIGGSFRLPEVMRLSGARLIEVGTTNRTRAADYRDAITAKTALLLKVHTSNYQVLGFTETTPARELADVAHQAGQLLVEDLGSGSLLATEEFGLAHEPTVRDALDAGADLVCFSADKLLGGPQAGVIAGREDLVARLGKNPLYRALRPDKLALAALEATLAAYLSDRATEQLPVWRMISLPAEETRKRADAWTRGFGGAANCEVVDVESAVGGGSLPGQVLKGFGVALRAPRPRPSATTLASRLRQGSPPVVARVHEGRVWLDPRTVDPDQDSALIAAVLAALQD